MSEALFGVANTAAGCTVFPLNRVCGPYIDIKSGLLSSRMGFR